MSNATHETAPPNSFRSEASGSLIGALAGLETSLCLNYFTATLDDWDPLVTNGSACVFLNG